MCDSTVPLHLGFLKESEKQPMEIEIEGGGSGSADVLGRRGKKRPPSPLGDEEEDSPTTMDSDDDWSVSDSGSEEEGDDSGNEGMYPPFTNDYFPSSSRACSRKKDPRVSLIPQNLATSPQHHGMYPPFTIDNFPRASCDHDKQDKLLYGNPRTKLHGPTPTRLFPAFKPGKRHAFDSDYNLDDKSEITVSNDGDCLNGCQWFPMHLLQFIDAKIAGYKSNHPGHAKIFGFVAARDTIKPLRNYVFKRSSDNCEAVSVKRKTGVARLSLISPSRVISMSFRALIKFELRALTEDDDTNGDDGPIIEGCTELYNMIESKSFIEHRRIYSERCALDIKYMVLMNAVKARVEVKVLRLGAVDGGVNMRLLAKTSGFSEVIRLFRGAAPKPGVMMSFAIAVELHSGFDLYIEGFPGNVGRKLEPYSCWKCGFASSYHGMDEEVAELGEFASVSVKVTWKSYLKKTSRGMQYLV